jgi:hypothetical protein
MADTTEREVVIKHGVFWYYAPDTQVINGEEKELLIQKMAFNGERVTLTRQSDIARGEQYDAFYSDDEMRRLGIMSEESAVAADTGEIPLRDRPDDEIVDWLMSTGEFDGNKKPTAEEVIAAAESDPDLAVRLLDAEETASGGNPRKTVDDALSRIIDADE